MNLGLRDQITHAWVNSARHRIVSCIDAHRVWPIALLARKSCLGCGWLWPILRDLTHWYVPVGYVLRKLTLTVRARDARVLLLSHLLTYLNRQAVVFWVTRLLSLLHLSSDLDGLLYTTALVSPSCFILDLRLRCILDDIITLVRQISFWSTFAHCFMLEDFARNLHLTVATLTEVDLVASFRL